MCVRERERREREGEKGRKRKREGRGRGNAEERDLSGKTFDIWRSCEKLPDTKLTNYCVRKKHHEKLKQFFGKHYLPLE